MIKNVILSIVLVAQLLVWFLVAPPWAKEQPKSKTVEVHKLEDIALEQIGRVEVEDTTGQSLGLAKRDGRWVIDSLGGFPAKQDKVEAAVAELAGLSRADYRTDKRFLHEDLEVDDVKSQKLKVFGLDNQLLADIRVGSQDIQGTRGTFIRMNGEDAVYVAPSQNLGTVFSTIVTQWYDPAMIDVATGDQGGMTKLKEDCYKFQITAKIPEKGDNGRPIQPFKYSTVRTTFEREVKKSNDGKEFIHWNVLEPEDKKNVVCDDLLVKGIIGIMLNSRANLIMGVGDKKEYGLDDEARMVECIGWFKDPKTGVETKRTLVIGAEIGEAIAAENAQKTGMRVMKNMRYARISHPGDKLQQSFVFVLPANNHRYFQREADMYEKK